VAGGGSDRDRGPDHLSRAAFPATKELTPVTGYQPDGKIDQRNVCANINNRVMAMTRIYKPKS